jgi:hypothetical protein
MTLEEIYRAVRRCGADTIVACAFRKALGIPQLESRPRVAARLDRYDGVEALMRQRYGVRM